MAYGVKKQIYAITTLFLCFSVRANPSSSLTLGFTHLSPNEVVAHKNKPLLLNCSGYTDPKHEPLSVSWLYEGEVVEEGNGYNILQNGSLLIEKVQSQRKRSSKRDDGTYQCLLRNKVGALLSKPIQVAIAYMAKTFTITPESITVKEGSVARFQCQILAVPSAVFTWYQNDQPLPLSDKWYETLPSGILQIKNISTTHGGQYHCVANNGIRNRDSPKFSLIVNDAFATIEPPQFLSIPTKQTVVGNDTVILECLVKSLPLPKLYWSKRGRNKTESAIDLSRVTITGQGNLVITNVALDDDGIYICVATVTDSAMDLTYNITQESTLTVHTPPKFTIRPVNEEKPLAITVRFYCTAEGTPTPTIIWYKNGELLHINGRIEVEKKSLAITQATLSDSGLYQCFANNSVKMISAAARLKVTTPNSQPQPPQGLIARTISSSSILLSWQPSLSVDGISIQAYTVHYWPTKGGRESQKVAVNTTQLIENLIPYTNYSFYARAYNDRSASEQSDLVTKMTGEDVPIGAPTVKLESLTPTTIKVSWNPLPVEIARGFIDKYRIYFRRHNQSFHGYIDVSGNILEYTITEREPRKKYEFRVIGGTKHGFPHLLDSQWPWEVIETPGVQDDKVPPPPNVQLTIVNSSIIVVNWTVELSEGLPPIKGYKLSYRKQGNQLKGPFQVPANVTTFNLDELGTLSPQTWFEVYLLAYNQNGDGEESVRTISTLPDSGNVEYVEPPSHLEAEPINSTAVQLQWKASMNNRNTSQYTIKYKIAYSKEDENSTSVKLFRSSKNEAVVTNLKPFTLYEFSLRSNDLKNLESRFNLKIECMTLEGVPGAPQDLTWKPFTSTSIRLSWLPPTEQNGNILAYHIQYKMLKPEGEEKWFKSTGSGLSTVLNEILLNSSYSISVRAETKAGLGPSSPVLSLRLPGRHNITSLNPEGVMNSKNDPFLGIILGVAIGFFFVIVCGIIILCRNRCYTFSNPETSLMCCCGKVEQIPCENGTLPHLERGPNREGSDFQEMAPMLTQISDHHHLDTKVLTAVVPQGGYPLTNGHANGIHYTTGEQNCKSLANGNAINRTNPLENHKGALPNAKNHSLPVQDNEIVHNGSKETTMKHENSSILKNSGITNNCSKNTPVPVNLNGSASKDQKPGNCPKTLEVENNYVSKMEYDLPLVENSRVALAAPALPENFDLDEVDQELLDKNSICKYISGAQEVEREPSLPDSCESDDEVNASVQLLLPSKCSLPITTTMSNVTAV